MMQFKTDPEKWQGVNYEDYLDGTIRYVKKVEDPYHCEVDDFADGIKLIEHVEAEPEEPKKKQVQFHPAEKGKKRS